MIDLFINMEPFIEARKEVGLTQAEVAECLGPEYSEDVISNYERKITPLPPKVADELALIYHKPELRTYYCSQCPLGEKAAAQIKAHNPKEAMCDLFVTHDSVGENLQKLGRIIADNDVSEDEREEYIEMMVALVRREKKLKEHRIAQEKEFGKDSAGKEIFEEIYRRAD